MKINKFFKQFICKHLYTVTFMTVPNGSRTIIVLECKNCVNAKIFPVELENKYPVHVSYIDSIEKEIRH